VYGCDGKNDGAHGNATSSSLRPGGPCHVLPNEPTSVYRLQTPSTRAIEQANHSTLLNN
jgi:hypothetical protein